MTINWKIVAPVGVVAIMALVLIGVSQFGIKSSQQTPIIDNGQNQEAPIKMSQDSPIVDSQSAVSDINEAVTAVLADIPTEESYFSDASNDGDLITADSQSINNFGQSYYENEF